MSRQDRACQPSAPEEVKVGVNESGYPICSLHDRQGEEEESEERGLSWQLREGYLTGLLHFLPPTLHCLTGCSSGKPSYLTVLHQLVMTKGCQGWVQGTNQSAAKADLFFLVADRQGCGCGPSPCVEPPTVLM